MNFFLLFAVVFLVAEFAAGQDNAWFQECLDSHNKYRSLEGKPQLIRGNSAMAHAQRRVYQLVSSCAFDHNGNKNSGFGENLYAGSGSYARSCSQAVTSWFNEKKFYSKSNPGFSMQTGHYTQVVWRSTTEIGCARGTYNCQRMRGMTVVVCSYNPPGNYWGKFPENV